MALARAACHALKLQQQGFLAAPGLRGMAGEGLKGFSEHEKTVEDLFFSKEDQRQLNHLLQKVKAQSDVVDRHGAAGVKAAELSALKPIVDKYKISSEDTDTLLRWKHTHY